MIRLTGDIKLLVYSDTNATTNPKQRIFDFLHAITNNAATEFQSKQLSIPDATTDLDIGFDMAEAQYFLLLTNQEITIKLNGGSESITINEFLFLKGPITALTVSNASGSAATVTIAFGY